MVKKNFLKSSLIVLVALAMVVIGMPKISLAATSDKPVFTYSAHVQTDGWKSSVFSSDTLGEPKTFAGTSGESKRVEGLKIQFKASEELKVTYRAHVQGIGWQDAVTATTGKEVFIGTEGQSRRVEAIKMSVEGLGDEYKLLYRAHVQREGWQPWVDAASNEFAGTEGKSLRIEAIELAVVSASDFKYQSNEDGTHTLKYKEVEIQTENCTYGEWAPATEGDDGSLERTCTLCSNKETKTLDELLSDESTTDIEVAKIKNELTVPVGKTLTVTDKIENNAPVTVNGTLVLEKEQTNLTLKGTGTVVYAPKAASTQEFNTKFTDADKILGGIKSADKNSAKSLKYEIKVPEMEEPQTITETTNITLDEGWNLTVDLGKNTLETKDTNNSFITNNGDLTLKNGVVKIPDNSKKFAIASDSNSTATLNLENVDIVGHSGISTNGHLVVKGGKIESTGTNDNPRALQIHGANAIKPITTELTDVDVKAKQVGIYIHTDPNHDLVMKGGNITVETNGGEESSAIDSSSQYSSITLDGTKITSEAMGIYLQNNGGSKANPLGGNVAHLNNVTIKSKKVCIWTHDVGDKVEVSGGSYTSTEDNAVKIYSRELNTFKGGCRLEGKVEAITVLGSLLQGHNFSEFVSVTDDVTRVNV